MKKVNNKTTVFNIVNLTKRQLRNQITKFARIQCVNRVVFNSKSRRLLGSYCATNHNIFLNNLQTKRSLILTFFHELGHHYAVKNKLWEPYHYDQQVFTAKEMFDVENKIDKIAKQLWNQFVDTKKWGRYKYVYPVTSKAILIKWFKDNKKAK